MQKADGTCNTNFKTTKTQEQVLQVFVEFIEGNTTILVSLNSSGSLIFDPMNLLQGHAADGVDTGTRWAVRSSWLRPVLSALAMSSPQVPYASKMSVKLIYGLLSASTMGVR